MGADCQEEGPPSRTALNALHPSDAGVGGAFVGCLVDLPFALAPMSPLLPSLVIDGKLCLGSYEAAAAGCIVAPTKRPVCKGEREIEQLKDIALRALSERTAIGALPAIYIIV